MFFIIIASVTRFINQKTLTERAKRREYQTLFTKQMVKMIMSKFEVLQNNKIRKEVDSISDAFMKIIGRDIKESRGFIFASDLPRFLIDMLKFGLIFRYGLQIFHGTA